MLTRLSAKSSKVSAVSGEAGSSEVSERLFNMSVRLEESRKILQDLRESPMKAIENSSDTMGVLKTADITVQANMLSTTSFNLMSLGIDGMVAALMIAKDRGTDNFSVGALTVKEGVD
eukprot:3694602-Pyramimonas_sp.AAC.1